MQKPAANSDFLWIIDYESSRWCGGQSYVVVRAATSMEAEDKACGHMADVMYELFGTEDEEAAEEGYDIDEVSYTVSSVEPFDEDHDCWNYYLDPVQRANFYPTIE